MEKGETVRRVYMVDGGDCLFACLTVHDAGECGESNLRLSKRVSSGCIVVISQIIC
jgi:hypothetical protein